MSGDAQRSNGQDFLGQNDFLLGCRCTVVLLELEEVIHKSCFAAEDIAEAFFQLCKAFFWGHVCQFSGRPSRLRRFSS